MEIQQDLADFLESLYKNGEKSDPKGGWQQIENLQDQLEESRQNNIASNQYFNTFLKEEHRKVTTNYIHMKEKERILLKNIDASNNQLQRLKLEIDKEKEKLISENERTLNRIENEAKNEIKMIKDQMAARKNNHKLNVAKLNDMLELAQATIDIEQDELETVLRRDLINLNGSIWHQQKMNTNLKIEIEETQRRIQMKEKQPETAPISDLVDFFQLERVDDIFEGTIENQCPKPSELNEINDFKRPSLPDGRENAKSMFQNHHHHHQNHIANNRESNFVQSPRTIQPKNRQNKVVCPQKAYKSKSKFHFEDNLAEKKASSSNKRIQSAGSLPTIKKDYPKTAIESEVDKTKSNKKRKLYNPDDLSYLDDFEPSQNKSGDFR